MLCEEPFKHRLQLGSELSRERTGELAATETGDGEQGMFAFGGGAGVHMLEHRQQAPFVESVIAFAIELAIRQRHLSPIGRRLAPAIAEQSARGEDQGALERLRVRHGSGVMTVVKDRHRHRDGDVAENAQLREVPVRAVASHRAFRKNLRRLGVEKRVEKPATPSALPVRCQPDCLSDVSLRTHVLPATTPGIPPSG